VFLPDAAPSPAIRPEWLFQVSTLLQRAVCEGTFTSDPTCTLVRVVPSLPLPRNRAEELALSGLLMTVIWGERLDNRAAIETGIRRLTATVAPGPRLSPARRAADRITRHPAEPLRIASLAQGLGLGETSLRRQFKREYGITLRVPPAGSRASCPHPDHGDQLETVFDRTGGRLCQRRALPSRCPPVHRHHRGSAASAAARDARDHYRLTRPSPSHAVSVRRRRATSAPTLTSEGRHGSVLPGTAQSTSW
jgi:AraC-like DNA-binding protein